MLKTTFVLIFIVTLTNGIVDWTRYVVADEVPPPPIDIRDPVGNDDNGEIILLQLIFRHGARTPIFRYPKDPYADTVYDEGDGGLTHNGKREMFRYGQTIRRRYSRYLDGIPLRNIKATSSPVRRCIESSQAVLAGAFTPQSESSQIWSPTIALASRWQPIAVFSVEPSRAYELGTKPDCAAADAMQRAVSQTESYKRFLADNQDFLNRFSRESGLDTTNFWYSVFGVADTLQCERDYYGREFRYAEWIDKVGSDVWDRMDAFKNFVFGLSSFLPARFRRLKSGPLIRELIHRMNETLDQEVSTVSETSVSKRPLVFTYGTHDLVLSQLLVTLGLFKEQPSFGSGIAVELRKNKQQNNDNMTKLNEDDNNRVYDDVSVHLYYVNGTQNFSFTLLRLNESETFREYCRETYCAFGDFLRALAAYIPDDIEAECASI